MGWKLRPRAEVPGRPITYGTTPLFLEYFGLASLEDLPVADELRRIPVQKPDALLTVNGSDGEASAEADSGSESPVDNAAIAREVTPAASGPAMAP